eukprot:4685257-Pleurochrysis_carterae.AAC.2
MGQRSGVRRRACSRVSRQPERARNTKQCALHLACAVLAAFRAGRWARAGPPRLPSRCRSSEGALCPNILCFRLSLAAAGYR